MCLVILVASSLAGQTGSLPTRNCPAATLQQKALRPDRPPEPNKCGFGFNLGLQITNAPNPKADSREKCRIIQTWSHCPLVMLQRPPCLDICLVCGFCACLQHAR